MRLLSVLLIFLCHIAPAQDVADDIQRSSPDRYLKYQDFLRIGDPIDRLNGEPLESLFSRVYPHMQLHHGIFGFKNWTNSNGQYVICFIEDDRFFDTELISGILLEPTGSNTFKVIKVGEWSKECSKTSVISVFRTDKKLFIATQDNYGINGVFNNVFIYSDTITSNKLTLERTFYEHCQYWWREDEEDSDYVYPQGGEDISNAKFVECNLSNYENILIKYNQR